MRGIVEEELKNTNGDNTMNNIKKHENNTAPDARDFLGGNYLRKEDLSGPVAVTIEDVRSVAVPNADRKKLVVWFGEITKPLILNMTNTRKMVDIFRSTNTATWRGQITLYVEASVHYGGKLVGGIRIQPAVIADPVDVRNLVHVPLANGQHTSESDLDDETDSYRVA
jgi:hypothetical protein